MYFLSQGFNSFPDLV